MFSDLKRSAELKFAHAYYIKFFRSELALPYDLARMLGYHPTPAFSVVPDSPECSVQDLAPASHDEKTLGTMDESNFKIYSISYFF